mgnify:CR=1 FL=1
MSILEIVVGCGKRRKRMSWGTFLGLGYLESI